jgi:hypothetical protein
MTHTVAIVLRIREEQHEEFERMFEAEELPIWDDFHASGKLLAATLARLEFGDEITEGVRGYLILAEFPSMSEHNAHDDDPRFNAFLPKARAFQPAEPLVWGGVTLFQKTTPARS